MQLKSIEYVIAVAETGNFTKAAERLYLSQLGRQAGQTFIS